MKSSIIASEKACNFRFPDACNQLASILSQERNDSSGKAKSREIRERGCRNGEAYSCRMLGVLEANIDPNLSQTFFSRAAELYKSGCERGVDPQSCMWLAFSLRDGNGVEKDLAGARQAKGREVALRNARCDDGILDECGRLASEVVYDSSSGREDLIKALSQSKQLCDKKVAEACRVAAEANGRINSEKNALSPESWLLLEDAKKILKLECDDQIYDSCVWLGQVIYDREPERAKKFYEIACDAGDDFGCLLNR
jgi:TPR repeat protein